MSLTTFIAQQAVKERLRQLPKVLDMKLNVPMLAPPRTKNNSQVGTAFDYLLRFSIEAHAVAVVSRKWVAWHGVRALRARDMEIEAEKRCLHAFNVHEEFVMTTTPSRALTREMAACALQLANLDLAFRNPAAFRFLDVIEEDVEDLLRLLEICPIEEFLTAAPVLLNPGFGDASKYVGGADADLIFGDVLVEIKTTVSPRVDRQAVYQLIGYLLLARRFREEDGSFPEVKRLGVYSARYGVLLSETIAGLLDDPKFIAFEEWFFKASEEDSI